MYKIHSIATWQTLCNSVFFIEKRFFGYSLELKSFSFAFSSTDNNNCDTNQPWLDYVVCGAGNTNFSPNRGGMCGVRKEERIRVRINCYLYVYVNCGKKANHGVPFSHR